jgi:rod shape-determining protein MreD
MRNEILIWTGWFLLCEVLQSTLVPHIGIASARPDLVMLVLFNMAVRGGMMPGAFVGFVIGLGHDLFSPSLLGQNALAMSVTGFAAGIFNERVMRLDPIMRGAFMIAAFIINDTIIMAVHVAKEGGSMGALPLELLIVTLPKALYTIVFAAIPFLWVNVVRPPRLVD